MLIVQLTDLHVRPRGMACNRVSETNMLTEQALRVVRRMQPQPDLVLITGDLTECGMPAEYENFATILRRALPGPVYVVPGNHDRRGNLRQHLAYLPGVTGDPEFVQYTIEDHPVRVVMLDTLVPGQSHGALSDSQLGWLDARLAEQPSKPTLVAMHHPAFFTGLPHMDRIALQEPERFAAVIGRHKQVQRIIAGHHHRPIVGQVAHAVATVSPSVAHQVQLTFEADDPGALNFEPPAYQIHLWQAATGFVTHTAYVQTYPGPFPFLTEPDYPGEKGD
ncbi:MAG TPA: phosphodiesterase [Rhodopila sp.]|uniref:phosphodiesterase n=1 Tax=Rhodopila sp. TaxID=2480087 RepID=UPI002B6EEB47|nr:phosphodiesterase [Rhodopila sp.]HVY14863.1 phosphodiesterase [Rhodopila sp.]